MDDIGELLIEMYERKASDLHISSGNRPMMRIHGEMTPVRDEPLSKEQVHQMLYDVMEDRIKAKFEETFDVDFALEFTLPGTTDRLRFRVNVFRQKNGEGAVFRAIKTTPPTFEELELPEVAKTLARKERGLVLVTGPTGSGKSSTLAAMIDLINNERAGHIITIEDPIEFVHPSKKSLVNQRELETHTKSLKNALRAALREDPDVILVGELRDYETTALAVEAAETGHLVFGTLHTINAAKTIDRLIDIFPPHQQNQIRSQLAGSLEGVISQLLMRTADGRGRVAAREIMVCNNAIRALIREGKVHQIPSVIETSSKEGMITLEQSLKQLIMSGRVTREEAIRKAKDLESLAALLEELGGPTPGFPSLGNLQSMNVRR